MLARTRFLSVPVGFFGSRAALISRARVSVSSDWFLSAKSIAILIEAASRALYVALKKENSFHCIALCVGLAEKPFERCKFAMSECAIVSSYIPSIAGHRPPLRVKDLKP